MRRDIALAAALGLLVLIGCLAGVVLTGGEPEGEVFAEAAEADSGETSADAAGARAASRVAGPVSGPAPEAAARQPLDPIAATEPRVMLAGTVRDAAGKPVAGADLVLALERAGTPGSSLAGEEVARCVSDEDGAFSVSKAPDEIPLVLIVRHGDHADTRVGPLDLVSGHRTIVDPVLRRGSTLRGTVRDEAGRPLAGVRVTALDPRARGEGCEAEAVSDAAGAFALERLADGSKTVWGSLPGRAVAGRAGLAVREGQPTPLVELVLAPGLAVAGRVVDDEGAAVAGAAISALRQRGPGETGAIAPLPDVFSDASGAFRIAGLAAGRWSLRARKDGFDGARAGAIVDPGDEAVELTLCRRPVLAGRVTDADSGEPVDTFHVIVSGSADLRHEPGSALQAVRDSDGRFEVAAPARGGRVWIFVRAAGYALGRSEEIPLTPGRDVGDVEVRLARGGVVTGRVVDARGVAVANAAVELVGTDAGSGRAAIFAGRLRRSGVRGRSGADGAFRLDNVPEGAWTLRVVHPAHCELVTPLARNTSGSGTLDLGEQRLERGGTIAGRCGAATDPKLKRRVVLRGPDGAAGAARTLDVAADGAFVFDRVAPGRYRLELQESAAAAILARPARTLDVSVAADETLNLQL